MTVAAAPLVYLYLIGQRLSACVDETQLRYQGWFQAMTVQDPGQLAREFTEARKSRVDAVLVLGSPLFFAHRKRIVELATQHRLPAMYQAREWIVGAGGLMSYGADFQDLFRRAAGYVDKIRKGAKPADLPVEQPTKYELVINLKAAKDLGLTIPQSVLLRADEVISNREDEASNFPFQRTGGSRCSPPGRRARAFDPPWERPGR